MLPSWATLAGAQPAGPEHDPSPHAGLVSPPEQEGFDILEQVQGKVLMAGTQAEHLQTSLCFPVPQRKGAEKTG